MWREDPFQFCSTKNVIYFLFKSTHVLDKFGYDSFKIMARLFVINDQKTNGETETNAIQSQQDGTLLRGLQHPLGCFI